MSSFLTLWRKELAAYFLSPIAYVMIMFFLVMMGFSFWIMVSVLLQQPGSVSVMNELFGSIFFWIAILIVVPVITMRLIAEEKRSGTIETLMTAPVTDASVVLSKYAGALSFYVIMWLPTIAYVYLLRHLGSVGAPVDYGQLAGGYFGAFLIGTFYIAIGVFASSLTQNQIVAAIICFTLICSFFFAGFLPYITKSELVEQITSYTSPVGHMLEFSLGTLDSRPITFYLTMTCLVLFISIRCVESRRWK